ncbi:MAG TPA: hypothetical protein VG755_26075 [Nannocystaceae bacterium]|nr:hypothetical protein [Nannocystaceae bacterium]
MTVSETEPESVRSAPGAALQEGRIRAARRPWWSLEVEPRMVVHYDTASVLLCRMNAQRRGRAHREEIGEPIARDAHAGQPGGTNSSHAVSMIATASVKNGL